MEMLWQYIQNIVLLWTNTIYTPFRAPLIHDYTVTIYNTLYVY